MKYRCASKAPLGMASDRLLSITAVVVISDEAGPEGIGTLSRSGRKHCRQFVAIFPLPLTRRLLTASPPLPGPIVPPSPPLALPGTPCPPPNRD